MSVSIRGSWFLLHLFQYRLHHLLYLLYPQRYTVLIDLLSFVLLLLLFFFQVDGFSLVALSWKMRILLKTKLKDRILIERSSLNIIPTTSACCEMASISWEKTWASPRSDFFFKRGRLFHIMTNKGALWPHAKSLWHFYSSCRCQLEPGRKLW